MSLYKFYITHDAQPPVEVFPMEFINSNIDWEKESGQMFFRKKFSGSLVFTNNNVQSDGSVSADYTYFKGIEDGADRCLEIGIDIHKSCDNGETYSSWWMGYFNVNDGEWNLDRCSVKFKNLQPDDEYRCLLEASENELNILSASPIVETSGTIVTDYEFSTCYLGNAPCIALHPPADGWLLFHTETIEGTEVRIYYREKTITGCLAGAPQVPSGSGWILESNDCATTGFATYVRTPVTVVTNNPNPDVAPGDCEDDGSGGYISSFPPRKKTLDVVRTNTPVSQDIIGYNRAMMSGLSGRESLWTFEVPCNPNSTYVWGDTGATAVSFTVSLGQGTCKVSGKFSGAGSGSCTVRVTETHGNAVVSTKTLLVKVDTDLDIDGDWSLTGSVIGITHVCDNQENIIFKIPDAPVSDDPDTDVTGPTWSVTGDATIVTGAGTNEITVDAGEDDFTVNCVWSIESTNPPAGSALLTLDVVVAKAARTPDVQGIDSVHPNEGDIVYNIQDRSGASYLWTVVGGMITAGQGTNEVTVDWDNSTGTGSITVKEQINCGCTYILISECGASGEPSFYWCPSASAGAEVIYDQNRMLLDAVTLFADVCDLDEVQSDFFEWNAPGDTPSYVAGINYVTGLSNMIDHIMIAQKSDIINPEASQPVMKGMISFEGIMTMLKEVFNVYWFIEDNNLRIEHESWFTRAANPDFILTSAGLRKWISGSSKYTYDKPKMPKYERFKWSEAQNTDFVGYEISYDSACVNQDPKSNVLNHLPGSVTTDLIMINSDPDSIEKTGFVLLANDLIGSTYTLQSDVGKITGLIKVNAHLSWANLHYNYHRHGRVLLSGSMNNEPTVFLSAKRTKKQDGIVFPYCCDAELNPLTELVTTYLGEGEIDKMSFSIKNNTMKTDLLHDI